MTARAAPRKYWGAIRGLGGWALALVVVGLIFDPLAKALFTEELRSEVIIQAVPFVAYFAALILVFILLVSLTATWLHRSVPARTHRQVEAVAIAGIVIGIVGLFQPWHQGPYQYAFNVLLFATLGFILWSHVVPRSAAEDAALPPFSRNATLGGLMIGVIVAALLFANLALSARPTEPYGMRQRRWNTLDAEQQQEVALRALREYRLILLPTLLVYSILPGLAAFLLVREFATPKRPRERPQGGTLATARNTTIMPPKEREGPP